MVKGIYRRWGSDVDLNSRDLILIVVFPGWVCGCNYICFATMFIICDLSHIVG
jgi:hypothetical protein